MKSTPIQDDLVVQVELDFEPLIPKFLAYRKEEVMAMREAVTRQDFEATGRIAHGMKGAGNIYGFSRIVAFASTIESASKTGSTASITTNLESLAIYLERVQVVFA